MLQIIRISLEPFGKRSNLLHNLHGKLYKIKLKKYCLLKNYDQSKNKSKTFEHFL